MLTCNQDVSHSPTELVKAVKNVDFEMKAR